MAKFNFIFNFGVTPGSKTAFENAATESETHDEFAVRVKDIPLKEMLMIHKYLQFASKKIHNIMYAERIDEIDVDLLGDFNGEEAEGVKLGQSKSYKKTKEKASERKVITITKKQKKK